MNKLITKARSGVTLVELLVVILIVTILSVSLLPLLKPYIEQAKYAAEVQPALANIQTKINLYHYENDKMPCTIVQTANGVKTEDSSSYDATEFTWVESQQQDVKNMIKYLKATLDPSSSNGPSELQDQDGATHIANTIDVDWQDLMGRRMNPSHFRYHLIKGLGAAKYGYAVGIFGDGDGLAVGTGYAILVLVDTDNEIKILATWERYKAKSDNVITFRPGTTSTPEDWECVLPDAATFEGIQAGARSSYDPIMLALKANGWKFNFSDRDQ